MPGVLTTQELVVWLRELVAELMEIDVGGVASDADLVDDLCIESLQQLELMTRVERRLCITFEIEAWLTPATLRDLAEYIIAMQHGHDDV